MLDSLEMSRLCDSYDSAEAKYKKAKSVDESHQACRDMKTAQEAINEVVTLCMDGVRQADLDDVAQAAATLSYYNTWALRKLLP